jgi:hypothetical protein
LRTSLKCLQKRKQKAKTIERKLVAFTEIYGDPKETGYQRKFKTKAVGVTKPNYDGSSRQEVIKRLRVGQKVRLVWDKNNPYDPNTIMLFPDYDQLNMEECFGHLKADLASDVVCWVTEGDLSVYAEVAKILGGTKKLPTLGCLLEITVY